MPIRVGYDNLLYIVGDISHRPPLRQLGVAAGQGTGEAV
jgi:hypothetical protein